MHARQVHRILPLLFDIRCYRHCCRISSCNKPLSGIVQPDNRPCSATATTCTAESPSSPKCSIALARQSHSGWFLPIQRPDSTSQAEPPSRRPYIQIKCKGVSWHRFQFWSEVSSHPDDQTDSLTATGQCTATGGPKERTFFLSAANGQTLFSRMSFNIDSTHGLRLARHLEFAAPSSETN